MIRVRVELCSANDGSVREIARMEIANDGGKQADDVANYVVRTLRGRSTKELDRRIANRGDRVIGHRKKQLHVWHLVAKALTKMGYGQ